MRRALTAGTASQTFSHDIRGGIVVVLVALAIGVPVWWKHANRYRPGGWTGREMRQIIRDDPAYQAKARERRARRQASRDRWNAMPPRERRAWKRDRRRRMRRGY